MNRRPPRDALLRVAVLVVAALAMVEGVDARGGGRGGGRGGSRGGAGFNRGGPAARGSFSQHRSAHRIERGGYDVWGPAADGSLGGEFHDRDDRQERRQERREERRDDWQEYADDLDEYADEFYDYAEDAYEGAHYGEEEAVVSWTLPCEPTVMALGGVVYYVCGSTWFVRAYSDGEVAYTEVPAPTQ